MDFGTSMTAVLGACLSQQFDYVYHLDETRAVEPLDRGPLWESEELAETFPSGL